MAQAIRSTSDTTKHGEIVLNPDGTDILRGATVTDGKLNVNASVSVTGGATEANQTNGSQKTQIVDVGGEAVTVTGGKLDVNASVDTTGLALDTTLTGGTQKSQIVDSGGEAVTVTGGKLDVNASVDTTGLALDTTLTGGTQKSQLVDAGGEAATVTGGKLDVNASIDTTGLATSAKQDTGNTSLGSIDTKTPALGQALAAASVPVILPSATITTLTPPAAITNFANETGGNLASVKTNTDKIPSQGQALAAASMPVVLTAAQVTTLTPPAAITGFATEATLASIKDTAGIKKITDALPAGTNAIGKLAANNGVDIGDVDVTSVIPGVGATNLGKAEDSGHSTGDVGVMLLGVRNEGHDDFSGTDKDYVPIATDATGDVYVSVRHSLPAGTAAIGKLAANDGVDIGDVTVNNAAGAAAVNIQDGGNAITVDGSVTAVSGTAANLKAEVVGTGTFVTQSTLAAETTKVIGTVNVAAGQTIATTNAGTFATQSAITAAASSIADAAIVTLGAKADAKSTATDTTAISAMSVLKQISASVQAPPSQAVTNAGTFAVQSTNQANSGVDIGDVTINNSTGAAAVNIQDGGNAITVDGTVAVTGVSTATNQGTANTLLGGIAGFTPTVYDYISLTYTGDNLTGVVFKTGGSGGTTVSTLTLAYTGAVLDSVTKT